MTAASRPGPGPVPGGDDRSGRGGPLRAVLTALDGGAGDLGEVAARTGLDRELVTAAVAHLIRSGYLQAEQLGTGCPATGCSGCGSYAAPGLIRSGGCAGDTTSADGRGPVLITINRVVRP